MKLSDFKPDSWLQIVFAIRRGEHPSQADIGTAIERSVRDGEAIPREAMIYVARLLKGELKRRRGAQRKNSLEQAEGASRKLRLAIILITDIERIRFELSHCDRPHTNACCIREYKKRWKRTAVTTDSLSREYRNAKSLLGAARVAKLKAHCEEINARKAGLPLPGGAAPTVPPAENDGTWVAIKFNQDGEFEPEIQSRPKNGKINSN
jgi:hypothetical protein